MEIDPKYATIKINTRRAAMKIKQELRNIGIKNKITF